MSDEIPIATFIDCADAQARLVAYVDSELPTDEAAAVERHCADCTECSQALADIQNLRKVLPSWSVDERYIWERVEARIHSTPTAAISPEGDTKLVEWLLERDILTPDQWGAACMIQAASPTCDIGRILMDLGFANERDVVEARALSEGVPFLDLTKHKAEPSAINVVPAHVAKKHNALPVKKDGQRLWVAMKNPRDVGAIDELRVVSHCMVQPMAAVPSDLERAMEEAYGTTPTEADVTLHQVLTEMRSLVAEVHALRGEVQTLREELAESRRQNVTRGSVLRIASSSRGSASAEPLPYAPPSDAPLPLS